MLHHLSILLWIPAAAALASGVLGRGRERMSRTIAIASAAITTIAALPLWFAYRPRGDEWQLVEHVPLLPSIGMSYSLGIDGFSLVLVLLTALTGLAVVASLEWSAGDRARLLYAPILALQFALIGLFLSLDLVLWLAFTILALVSATRLVRTSAPDRSIAWLWRSTVFASAFIVVGLLILSVSFHALSGAYGFDIRVLRPATIPRSTQASVFGALSIGFAVAFASFVVRRFFISLLCAAVVLEIAAYTFVRIHLPVFPDASRAFGLAAMTLAIASTMVGAFLMLTERAWDRRAAYAIVVQAMAGIAGAFALTPDGITGSMILASLPGVGGLAGGRLVVEGVWPVSKALAVLLGVTVALSMVALVIPNRGTTADRGIESRRLALIAAFLAVALAIAFYPSPLVRRLETSAARVVVRVSPEYAADVADCLSKPPPPPAETGLPPGVVMAAPCEDGTKPPNDPHKK